MGKQFYDKSKPELMKDYIHKMNLKKEETFDRSKFIDSFSKQYPLYQKTSIELTVRRLTVNDNKAMVTGELDESDDLLWKIDGYTLRLYDKEKDEYFTSVKDRNKIRDKKTKKHETSGGRNVISSGKHPLFKGTKIEILDVTLFRKIEECIERHLTLEEKIRFKTIAARLESPPNFEPYDFALEAIYVVLASGFKQKRAKNIFDSISSYLVRTKNTVTVNELFPFFKNVNKINAISKIWSNRNEYQHHYYSLRTEEEKISFLETLPYIGAVTKNHLARNLGISVVKYDIWVRRLGIALYGNEKMNAVDTPPTSEVKDACDKIFDKLEKETGYKRGYIDLLLWKACESGVISFATL